jgi:hypothetical protein
MYTQWTNLVIALVINNFKLSNCIDSNVFQCKNNQNINFLNIERFTDNMCAQCFWYMAGVENAWKQYDIVSNWYFRYNYSDSVNVLLCKPKCVPFKFSDLNKNDKDNDTILSEFKYEFHMV